MKLVDSSCIICLFNEINRPYILTHWFDKQYQIVVTQQVYGELQRNPQTKQKVDTEIKNGRIKIENLVAQNELDSLKNRYPTLGEGELSIIQAALKLNTGAKKYYAVLDDGNARKVATKLNVRLTGTFGLLKALKDKGWIDENHFKLCKEAMDKSNFRINFNVVK
jgi:predicted nucleic acid-binding protein